MGIKRLIIENQKRPSFSGPKTQVELLAPELKRELLIEKTSIEKSIILMMHRSTKRGDELRKVVLLNIIQWSKA